MKIMKRKFTLLAIACFVFISASQAQYNLFQDADVDVNGWIWFDTQAKIDKYIGQANNEDMQYDPNGKLVQLACADFDPYEDSTADPSLIGAGTDGELGGPDAKTGGIILAAAQAQGSTNGGSVIIKLPSTCTSFNVFFSADSRMLGRFMGASDGSTLFRDYTAISVKSLPPFAQIGSAGQKSWDNMEKLDNGFDPPFSVNSASPMHARIENCQKYPLYIHGMKILTSTPTSIGNTEVNSSVISFDGKTLSVNEPADISVYTVAGSLAVSDYASSVNLSNLVKGIYVVKVKTTSGQKTTKIAIR